MYQSPSRRRAAAGPALVALLFGVASPVTGAEPDRAARSFVGALGGAPRSARVAVVVQGGRFLAYVCSQDADFNRGNARWLRGDLGAAGEVRAAAEGVELRGTAGEDRVTGTVIGPDRKPFAFVAARVPAHGDAGLYRSMTKADGAEFVAGWIVDTEDNVAGAVHCHGRVVVIVTPRPGRPGANLNPRAPDVPEQVSNRLGKPGAIRKVNEPAPAAPNEGEVRGVKIDAAARAETLAEGVARVKARGGSPLLAVFLHQARRRLAGTQPATPLEERLGERFGELPPDVLKQAVARFDGLPAADREALLGALGQKLTAEGPLDEAALDALSTALAAGSPKKPPRGSDERGVRELRVGEIVCVRESPPSGVGSDDVLVVLVAASGRTLNVHVSEPVRGLDTGVTKPLPREDGRAWPPPDGKPATEEVVLSAALIEDDSGKPEATAALFRAYAAVTTEAAAVVSGGLLDFDLTEPLTQGFAALAAVHPSAVFLGSDRVVASSGTGVTGADGKPRERLTIKQLRADGAVKVQYELRRVAADAQKK